MPFQVPHDVLPALERMGPGDHCCCIYRSDEDQRRVVTDWVRLGLERHERMLYVVNLQSASQLQMTFAFAGIDAEELVGRGQLILLTAKDAYLKDGGFEPEKMIEMLVAETDRAVADGYTALRTNGEMTWALAGEPGCERFLEYEAMLNSTIRPGRRCYSICQYDQRRFDADMLLDVLHTHPHVLVGQHGFDNAAMYYVPEDKYLSASRPGAMLDTWLGNLLVRAART